MADRPDGQRAETSRASPAERAQMPLRQIEFNRRRQREAGESNESRNLDRVARGGGAQLG